VEGVRRRTIAMGVRPCLKALVKSREAGLPPDGIIRQVIRGCSLTPPPPALTLAPLDCGGAYWFRPDGPICDGMPRTIRWPRKSSGQTLTANEELALAA